MGKKDGPDVEGAAYQEGQTNLALAREAQWANMQNSRTPFGTSHYTPYTATDPTTGQQYTSWTQNHALNAGWQNTLNGQQALIDQKALMQAKMHQDFLKDPGIQQYGHTNVNMNKGDFLAFGQTDPTIRSDQYLDFGTSDAVTGANDWAKFGYSSPTTGSEDWRQFGTTGETIGAGDWRQFGNAEQTIHSGDFDARFGQGRDNPYGDHSMEGGNWDLVNYAPEHIRQQAQADYYAKQAANLDPQFARQREQLEIKLANQGLGHGDAAYDAAMSSFEKNRNAAYEQARLGSLDASRMEAAMLWDQEMGRSNQKNQLHQADIDNIYRARQSNIQNYLSGRKDDMQGYLSYQDAAFNQDMARRQLELSSNLQYGREAYQQDLQSRQQQLDADLKYGNQAWSQDYNARQQALMANLQYNQQNWQQDYYSRQQQMDAALKYGQASYDQQFNQQQANVDNYLNYSNSQYQQDLGARQQMLDAYLQQTALQNQRYQMMDPTQNVQAVTSAFGGG